MIIIRRIIVAVLTVSLTACDTPQQRARIDAVPPVDSGTAATSPDRAPAQPDVRTVLFVGTSLTAGYGVGVELAYPAVLQQMIDSAGLPFRVVNAGISGETSAGGLRRIDWSLQQPADVLVLELGANDALRGLDPDRMRDNLDALLDRARAVNPGIALVIVGMEAPPNLGDEYAHRFRSVYPDLARVHDAVLVPFLLDGVAAEPALNLEDGIHPNVAGHRILARNVWESLAPLLHRLTDRASLQRPLRMDRS